MENRAQVKKTIATQNKGNGNANAALGVQHSKVTQECVE